MVASSNQMKQLPLEELPRERFMRLGPQALSTCELLALLLDTGTLTRSVLQLAEELLAHFNNLSTLSEASVSELMDISGIGPAKALRLKAAFALAARLSIPSSRVLLDTPESAARHFLPHLNHPVETLYIALRNSQKQLIHLEQVACGTLNSVATHPREILHIAIRHRAHTLLIAHNHPSGDPRPSLADLTLTATLDSACRAVQIPLIDHLIISPPKWLSLVQAGLFHATY